MEQYSITAMGKAEKLRAKHKAIADIYDYISRQRKNALEDAKRYHERAQEQADAETGTPDAYMLENAVECEAQAEAWDGLMSALEKAL